MYYGEKLNSISHLVGAVFSFMALGSLLTVSIQIGEPMLITAFSAYGFSLAVLYSMSTLYHSFEDVKLKKFFKLMDHISIYLFIAGSYTPFLLISLGGVSGTRLFIIVWILAVVGILSELFLKGKAIKIGQVVIYLAMGWTCSLDIASLKDSLPGMGFTWLLIGGLAYTFGVVFYILDKAKKLKHAHGVWHFFVLLGSITQFISVIGYVR